MTKRLQRKTHGVKRSSPLRTEPIILVRRKDLRNGSVSLSSKHATRKRGISADSLGLSGGRMKPSGMELSSVEWCKISSATVCTSSTGLKEQCSTKPQHGYRNPRSAALSTGLMSLSTSVSQKLTSYFKSMIHWQGNTRSPSGTKFSPESLPTQQSRSPTPTL